MLCSHPTLCFPFRASPEQLALDVVSPAPSPGLGGHSQLLHCHPILMLVRKLLPTPVQGDLSITSWSCPKASEWAQKEEDAPLESPEGGSVFLAPAEGTHPVCQGGRRNTPGVPGWFCGCVCVSRACHPPKLSQRAALRLCLVALSHFS